MRTKKKTAAERKTPGLRKETVRTLSTLSDDNLVGVAGGVLRTQCHDPTFVSGGYCCS